MNVLDVQIGGQHYKNNAYQPVCFAVDMNFNFIQGNIVKYVTRYENKNGRQDLEKALHYACLGKQLRPKNFVPYGFKSLYDRYIRQNNLGEVEQNVVYHAIYQSWDSVVASISQIIVEKYEQSSEA